MNRLSAIGRSNSQSEPQIFGPRQASHRKFWSHIGQKRKSRTGYSIEDHLNLNISAIGESYLQHSARQFLALDPCVKEKFLKLYVAYKARNKFCGRGPANQAIIAKAQYKVLSTSKIQKVCAGT